MMYVLRICLLAFLIGSATAYAQKPVINTLDVNDNRICEIAGSYSYSAAGYTWDVVIEKVKGRYIALVTSSNVDFPSGLLASIRLKQVPPTNAFGLDSIRLEGTGATEEEGRSVSLILALRKNNNHDVRIVQGTFNGSFAHNTTFVPDISERGIHVSSPQVVGNKVFYTAMIGSPSNVTNEATAKGLKMGECTLKVAGPKFKVTVPGSVSQVGLDLIFNVSTEKAAAIKIDKIRYGSMQPFEFVSGVIDAQ